MKVLVWAAASAALIAGPAGAQVALNPGKTEGGVASILMWTPQQQGLDAMRKAFGITVAA